MTTRDEIRAILEKGLVTGNQIEDVFNGATPEDWQAAYMKNLEELAGTRHLLRDTEKRAEELARDLDALRRQMADFSMRLALAGDLNHADKNRVLLRVVGAMLMMSNPSSTIRQMDDIPF